MILSPERRTEITRPDARYIISCWTPPCCLCDKEGTKCTAGFFSLFIRVLYGIRLALKHHVPYYVDFGSVFHAYSDPKKFDGDTNFWNYYFRQPMTAPLPSEASMMNTLYETHPLRIWSRSFLRKMHHIVQHHITLQPTVERMVRDRKQDFEGQKVLGVHIRRTDHPTEIEPVPLATFKKAIRKEMHHYDKVFVATDDQFTLSSMINEFGHRIVYNDAKRSTTGAPLHAHQSHENRYEIGLEALLDAYCLSFCQKAILVHSNLSYAALLFNPSLKYLLLETPRHRNKRLKTLLIYYLDQIGIRLPKR